ncbi:MAG: putative ABC transporter permease [Ruminiclostridium sp.]
MREFEMLVIYFSIFSLIGWLCEVLYCSVISKKIVVNRGFLAGPVCPVYGFGALFVIWLLKPVEASIPIVFLSGIVITSTLEYITGWLLEVFFSTRWWDYRNRKFNIDGRVCLRNSVFFGILSVVLMKIIYPFTLYVVELLPDFWMELTSAVLLTTLIVDSVFTINTLVNLHERLKKLHEFTEDLKKNADIHEWFNESEFYKSFEKLKLIAEEGRNEINHKLRGKFEALTDKKNSGLRLIKAFPDVKSIKYDIQLNHLREALKELKQRAMKNK